MDIRKYTDDSFLNSLRILQNSRKGSFLKNSDVLIILNSNWSSSNKYKPTNTLPSIDNLYPQK